MPDGYTLCAYGKQSGIRIFKQTQVIAEGSELSRADKCKVHRIEEQDQPMAFIGIKAYVNKIFSIPGERF